ncbi:MULTISPECIES: hypothetical protein [unclassified Mesorhizobium]|uniref:hypothetical protein n=1 Tax=unclassified Mesorhizobium TaxID=325217 RepID=UPI001125C057|nr:MULTISPECIES: hypothetical protein [unclassified Mesorhizobium]MBZ9916971.1 hypothetical protein [Mesorhizobium sp. BR1-1-7]MBZ9968107.1 hypothetical protein [Mesorhizobium sp. BR1-1-12]TPK65049.1 hypothetical protein FJ551_11020 [Mesorhizobium sp. B2-5-1]TPL97039.1 hypothetical protein FJ939_28125 [Mesorhizobium sp. B2-3-8]TPM07007.1 hypothetical protein FJ940_28185 [Mesorhizobium sp. B2-3-7]
MTGKKTHEQQVQIIEERVNTKNADKNFNAEDELKRSKRERTARQQGQSLRGGDVDLVDADDREMLRGSNQESRHHKRPAD